MIGRDFLLVQKNEPQFSPEENLASARAAPALSYQHFTDVGIIHPTPDAYKTKQTTPLESP